MYARDPSNKDGLAISYDFDPANVVKTTKGQVSCWPGREPPQQGGGDANLPTIVLWFLLMR